MEGIGRAYIGTQRQGQAAAACRSPPQEQQEPVRHTPCWRERCRALPAVRGVLLPFRPTFHFCKRLTVPLFDVVEAQPPFGMEVIRGKWMTIPVGQRQFFEGFRAECQLPLVSGPTWQLPSARHRPERTARPAHGRQIGRRGGTQVPSISGLRVRRAGKRLKSRSTLHSSRTP